MSSHTKVIVTCPKCNKEHSIRIWRSINTTLDPEMKAAVRDRSAFLFTCPSCDEKTYMDYGFLYHQMEDRIMIHYASTDENADEIYEMLNGNDPTGMITEMRKNNYLIRIVRSQNELREKIAIFDEGLDDRIIEIFKIYILVTFQKDHPDCKQIETLYFRDGEKNLIQILADGESYGVAEIPDKFYKELCEEYRGKIPDIRKDEPYIDRQWALKTMGIG